MFAYDRTIKRFFSTGPSLLYIHTYIVLLTLRVFDSDGDLQPYLVRISKYCGLIPSEEWRQSSRDGGAVLYGGWTFETALRSSAYISSCKVGDTQIVLFWQIFIVFSVHFRKNTAVNGNIYNIIYLLIYILISIFRSYV